VPQVAEVGVTDRDDDARRTLEVGVQPPEQQVGRDDVDREGQLVSVDARGEGVGEMDTGVADDAPQRRELSRVEKVLHLRGGRFDARLAREIRVDQ
jgi:hypothetical protein